MGKRRGTKLFILIMGRLEMTTEKETNLPDIEVRDAIMEVRKTLFGKEEVSQERMRIRPFVTTPASISIKAGFTKNMGNYESMRVDIMATMPCYVEEIDEAYKQVQDWVDARVNALWDEAEGKKS